MGQTYQSTVIGAPVEKVWDAVRNFHDLGWAPGVVRSLEAGGSAKGDQIGAQRVINGVFHETLVEFDEAGRTFAYSIDDGPPPVSNADVSNYRGRVTVRPVTEGGGTFVEWSSSWQKNDSAAADFCHGIYVALLADMKKSLERSRSAFSTPPRDSVVVGDDRRDRR